MGHRETNHRGRVVLGQRECHPLSYVEEVRVLSRSYGLVLTETEGLWTNCPLTFRQYQVPETGVQQKIFATKSHVASDG